MSQRITQEELDRLRQLHEQASPGPWEIRPHENPESASQRGYAIDSITNPEQIVIGQLGCGCCDIGLESESLANFQLIIQARNALPALLDEITYLQAELERNQPNE